ncbi:MAG TPA: hypothetical protein VKD72_33550, partial [Gemmataceae bacterium]|nr:hypothetical protein [Gemmataceae bacterium]
RLADLPLGEASWLTLSSDRKSLIGVAAFSRAYDISGTGGYDNAPRIMWVRTGVDSQVRLPVAPDAKVVLDGEDATLAELADLLQRRMPVLVKPSDDRKSIVGIVTVHNGHGPPLPRPAGR